MNEGELFYGGEDNRPDVYGMRPGAEQGQAGKEVKARPQPVPGEVDTIGANELSFSAEEYLGRIASVRNRMVDQGLLRSSSPTRRTSTTSRDTTRGPSTRRSCCSCPRRGR